MWRTFWKLLNHAYAKKGLFYNVAQTGARDEWGMADYTVIIEATERWRDDIVTFRLPFKIQGTFHEIRATDALETMAWQVVSKGIHFWKLHPNVGVGGRLDGATNYERDTTK